MRTARLTRLDGATVLVAVSALALAAVAMGHPVAAFALAAAPLVAVVVVRGVPRSAGLLHVSSSRAVGVAWLVLVVSTFTWRARTTTALDANPLDGAALVRVACVFAAGLLLLAHLLRARRGPGLPLPLKLFIGYVAISFVAAAGSPQPAVAAYRFLEEAVGALALVAVACEERERWPRALELMLALLGAIVVLVWIEAAAMPHRGWEQVHGVVDWALIGAVPSFSSNSLGEYGAVLAAWGAGMLGVSRYRLWAPLALAGGLATLLAAQYRTGVLALAAALAFVAWRRRNVTLALLVLGAAALLVASGKTSSLRGHAEVAFARGNASTIRTLDSRSVYWHAAIPAIRERPVFGWGLNVGTRRVLSSLGLESTSTIHSTWVEALLGTGLVGFALLAGAFLTLLASAGRCRGPDGAAIGGVAIVVTVRSLTGSTAELFDVNTLLVGALILAAAAVRAAQRP